LVNLWTILYLGWLSAILWLSLDSSPPELEGGLLGWDKFQHAAAYAVLTILGGLSLCRFLRSKRACFPVSAAVAVTIGFLVEIAQGLMRAGRFAEWQDALANLLGAIFAVILAACFRSLRSR
jgi:VanZ family protein